MSRFTITIRNHRENRGKSVLIGLRASSEQWIQSSTQYYCTAEQRCRLRHHAVNSSVAQFTC
jgi:hypothetical protein